MKKLASIIGINNTILNERDYRKVNLRNKFRHKLHNFNKHFIFMGTK